RAGRDVADTYGTRDQPICVPVADRASVTGWKKVVPPEEQSPLPPEVRPTALLPEKSEPPLSPGSAHTSVWIRPLTMSPLPEYTGARRPVTVPEGTSVVEPLRVTCLPAVAAAAPEMACVEPR